MARFVFSMQNILNMKAKLEDQAKDEYGMANAALIAEEQKLQKLKDRKTAKEEELKSGLVNDLSVLDIRRAEQDIDIFKGFIENQKLEVKKKEKDVERARNKLAEAMKERKMFEKLKEKAFEQFKKDELKAEQVEVDELVSYKYTSR